MTPSALRHITHQRAPVAPERPRPVAASIRRPVFGAARPVEDWQPVRLVGFRVEGIDADDNLVISAFLGGLPPVEWGTVFRELAMPGNGHRPIPAVLNGDSIRVLARDAGLERRIGQLRDRVEKANGIYAARVLPELMASAISAHQKAVEDARRIQQAQDKLDRIADQGREHGGTPT